MTVTLFHHFAGPLRIGVILAIALHALALVLQMRARYFQPRHVNVSVLGLVLAVAHGAALALANSELAPDAPYGRAGVAAWCLAAALLLNLVVAAHNLLAVVALLRLHRASAVIAHGLRGAVQPMVWSSAALVLAAWAAVHGWF